MQFKDFSNKMQIHVNEAFKNETHLFVVDVNKDEMWNLYLDSFPEGTNPIYRTRREFDCGCCRNFVKQFGNVVALKDNKIVSIWNFQVNDDTFQTVIDTMDAYITSKLICDVFVTDHTMYGTVQNHELSEGGHVITWNHFNVTLPVKFRSSTDAKTLDTIRANYRNSAEMLKKSLLEISPDAITVMLDLVKEKALYRGEEFAPLVKNFQALQKEYMKLSSLEWQNFVWSKSIKVGGALCSIKNSVIGTFLVDVTKEEDVDAAVRMYEAKVAPENYKRSKPVFTEKMKNEAKATLEKEGLLDSLPRRFATPQDVSVRDTLWVNRGFATKMKDPIFDAIVSTKKPSAKNFDNVSAMSIADFMELLPSLTGIRAMFDAKLTNRLVSLTTAKNEDAKPLFKWGNNVGWAYNGNIADSSMKEAVAAKGGKVDGVLRFSISWTHGDDLDAHCMEPNNTHIYFGNKHSASSLGQLDVDIMSPVHNVLSVENITWALRNRMHNGTYKFYVNNYSKRDSKDGFKAEIEFDGQLYQFDYTQELRTSEQVEVATVTLNDGKFTIKPSLPTQTSSREIWGLQTNEFQDVNMVTYSPSFWNDAAVGNKHVMFMLKDAKNPDQPSGFFNEYLHEDLKQHRKVLEALGSAMRVEDSDNQLTGLGFSSTQSAELILEVTSSNGKRVIKVRF